MTLPLLLTREQTAEACQVSLDTIDQWTHTRGFPVIRQGRLVRIPVESLNRWLAEQAAGHEQALRA